MEVTSQVVAVTRGHQEDGQHFLALRVRSLCGDRNTENVATIYVRPDLSFEQFQESARQSREWFAEQFAQEMLGIDPRRPNYWFVVASNPNDASKRVQGLAVCDPTAPRSQLSEDLSKALDLPGTDGNRAVLLRVLGKKFLAEVTLANASVLAVIGRDLLGRAILEDPDREGLLESFFLDPAARSYVARRKSRAKTVLVIGSYTNDGIRRLRRIEGLLFNLGYDPVLIADYPTESESLEAKFLSFATISRFVIYEATIPSGGIDEFKTCKDNDFVTAVLHEKDRMATSMQGHYAQGHTFIKYFGYEQNRLEEMLRDAAEWAESVISDRKGFYAGPAGT